MEATRFARFTEAAAQKRRVCNLRRSAAAVINVLSRSLSPVYAASGGRSRVAAIGLGENAPPAVGGKKDLVR